MALRVLNYLTNFYMDYVQAHRRVRKLPPVFPIVLYNGDAKWTAPARLETLIERSDLLGKFGVGFEYFKIAENAFSRDSLLKIRNIVSTLFLAETHYDVEVLTRELMTLFDHEPDKQAVSLLINWFRQLAEHDRIEETDYTILSQVYHDREEVQSMLVKALAKEKRQIYDKGKEEGLKEGKEEGLKEGKYTIAQSMLKRGISVEDIAEITELSEEEIRSLEKQ